MSNETEEQKALKGKHDRLRRELGPVVMNALADPRVMEVMVNPDGKIFLDKIGEGMLYAGEISPINVDLAMRSIAALLKKDMNYDNPRLEGKFPLDGSRFAGAVPPIADAPMFALRKRSSLIFTLADYVAQEVLSQAQADAITAAVVDCKNILIVGGTGSGKTTFANAILAKVAEIAGAKQRVLIIEDTPELQCAAQNKVELLTSTDVGMNELLHLSLRLRPDRIVVGETRDFSALSLLKAWNTGHPGGLSTIHANSAEAGLIRMEQLIQEGGVPPQPMLIAEAVNLIVFIKKTHTGVRKVTQLIEVKGYDAPNLKYITASVA